MACLEAGSKRGRNEAATEVSASPPVKRQAKDTSLGFTKAVIICKSSELSRSDEKTYRPNNIVIELLKKNPRRYGKVVFERFATEEQIRKELCLTFTILRNKKVSFASADQYGRLNFHESEKWSGKNVRRWLPGSSAMYLILEGGDEESEPPTQPTYSIVVTSNNPSSGLSYTTIRTSTTNEAIMSWQSNRSQRALLDLLSSPERGKIDQSTRRKTFGLTCSRAKTCGLPRSHSYPIFTNADSMTATKIHSVNSDADIHKNLRAFHSSTISQQTLPEQATSNASVHSGDNVNRGSELVSEPHKERFGKSTDNTKNKASPNEDARDKHVATTTNSHALNKTSTLDQEAVQRLKINGTQVTDYKEDVKMVDLKKMNSYFARSRSTANRTLDFHSNCQQRTGSSSLEGRRPLTRSDLIRDTIQSFVQATTNYSAISDNSRQSNQPNKRRLDDTTERHHGCASVKAEEEDGGNCRHTREPGNQSTQDFKSFSSKIKKMYGSKIVEHFPNEYYEQFKNKGDHDEKHQIGENLKLKKKTDSIDEVEIANGEKQKCGFGSSCDKTQRLNDADLPSCFVPCYMVPSPFYHGQFYRPMTPFTPGFCVPRNSGATWKDLHDSLRSSHTMYEGNMIVPRDLPNKEVNSDVNFVDVEDSRMDVDENTADQSNKEHTENSYHEIIPNKGTCKGGDTFVVLFKDPILEHLSVIFKGKSAVDLMMYNPYVLKGQTPDSSEPGPVTVTITAEKGKVIGQTRFMYLDDITGGLSRGSVSPAGTSSEEEKHIFKEDITTVLKRESPQDCMTDNSSDDLENDKSHSCQTSSPFDDCVALEATTNKNDMKEADNLLLLSSIASKIKHHTTSTTTTSTTSKHTHTKQHTSTTSSTSTNSKHKHSKQTDNKKGNQSTGFHKKVFVLPANSMYLPSQSDLCKLRTIGNYYSKVFFHASMSEDDVIAQIRATFPDLGESSLRLAIVDQTGRLVFHDEIWTGRTIRKKLRGNSVLYVAPRLHQ